MKDDIVSFDPHINKPFVYPEKLFDFLKAHHCLSPDFGDDDVYVIFRIFSLNDRRYYSYETFVNALWTCCDSDTTFHAVDSFVKYSGGARC